MKDSEIVQLYWDRDAAAITETGNKYGAYCFTVANNILNSNEDAEECVNDTYLKAWNAIPPHKPEKLKPFLAKITRNLAFNRYNARTAKKRGGELGVVLEELAECIPCEKDVESEYAAKELGECIRLFAGSLPVREGDIFVRRYFFTESIEVIAKRFGMTENNVMVTLSRIRKKLKTKLIKEGMYDE